jgi:AcrR family transcriptional regulator
VQIGRRERKKLELRERIVDAAGALIGRQGLAQTTVDQIADACDIAQATFFNYFASKGALVDALVGRLAETFNDVLEGVPGTRNLAGHARLAGGHDSDHDSDNDGGLDVGVPAGSAVELLFGFTAALRPEEQRVVRDILVESARTWSPATLEAMSRTRDLFIADIAAGQERGDVRADRAADDLADAALGLYFSVMLFWTAEAGDPLSDRLETTRGMVVDLLKRHD